MNWMNSVSFSGQKNCMTKMGEKEKVENGNEHKT